MHYTKGQLFPFKIAYDLKAQVDFDAAYIGFKAVLYHGGAPSPPSTHPIALLADQVMTGRAIMGQSSMRA